MACGRERQRKICDKKMHRKRRRKEEREGGKEEEHEREGSFHLKRIARETQDPTYLHGTFKGYWERRR